jgi:riboflavin kinase / FMN adenylyltransferase
VRIFRGLPASADISVALTIGTFDGVHRGHQAMLSRLVEAAEDLALVPAVLTFEPHPREFFFRETAPARLLSLRGRLERFAASGVARTFVARFDAVLAALTPKAFVDDVLIRRLDARWVLVGEDFRFGKGRAGDIDSLRKAASSFSVEVMRTVGVGGERASSSAIRGALAAGDLARAASLLGRSFTMAGRVSHGERVGRRLGFPTANLRVNHKPPLTGVYAVRVHGLGSSPRQGVASLGVRPTVTESGEPLLEVFILDFDESIYGRRVVVEFLYKLREEERFSDLAALIRQIQVDVAQAREYFSRSDVMSH